MKNPNGPSIEEKEEWSDELRDREEARIQQAEDDDMRVVILRACGWKIERIVPQTGHVRWTFEDPTRSLSIRDCYEMDGVIEWPKCLPDCLNDLNAMHACEKTLNEFGLYSYYERLMDICCEYPGTGTYSATARQRARAFYCNLMHT